MLEIKTDIIPTVKNKMLGLVHYTDGKTFYSKCMVSDKQTELINFLDTQKRDIVLNIIKKYVAHREYSINQNFSEKTQKRINAVNKLKQAIQIYGKSNSFKLFEIIICLEEDIMTIMPGINSKFYKNYQESISQLLTYCKTNYHEQTSPH